MNQPNRKILRDHNKISVAVTGTVQKKSIQIPIKREEILNVRIDSKRFYKENVVAALIRKYFVWVIGSHVPRKDNIHF